MFIAGIDQQSSNSIIGLLRNYPAIESAKVFGSRAKGNFREGSDIDVALFGASLKHSDLLEIQIKYEDLNLPWKLDLILYSTIQNDELKEHINRQGISLW